MNPFYMKAANEKHFLSLIKDFKRNGFKIITLRKRIVDMKKDNEYVTIEY